MEYSETKIIVTQLREYNLSWIKKDAVLFMKGNPSKTEIVDEICRTFSKDGEIYIDARFETAPPF